VDTLIDILNRLKLANPEIDQALLTQAITLAKSQSEELESLSQIIRDIRERDARKKCLCRGFK